MQLWASCDPCDRWFLARFERLEHLSDVVCPVCGAPASSFEARSDDLSFTLDIPPAAVDVVVPDPLDVTENRVIWLR